MSMKAIISAIASCIVTSALAVPTTITTTTAGTVASSGPAFTELDDLVEGSGFALSTTVVFDTLSIQHEPWDNVWGHAEFSITAGAVTLEYSSMPNSAHISVVPGTNPGAADGFDNFVSFDTIFTTADQRIYDVSQTIWWKDDSYDLADLLSTSGSLTLPAEHRISLGISLMLGGDGSSYAGFFVDDYHLDASAVPEPQVAIMLLTGLALLHAYRRRQGAAKSGTGSLRITRHAGPHRAVSVVRRGAACRAVKAGNCQGCVHRQACAMPDTNKKALFALTVQCVTSRNF